MADPPRTHEDYQIGVICALATEKAAIVAMMDETHPKLKKVGPVTLILDLPLILTPLVPAFCSAFGLT
jgi:hypothetical protein